MLNHTFHQRGVRGIIRDLDDDIEKHAFKRETLQRSILLLCSYYAHLSSLTYRHSMNYTGALMNFMPENSYNGVAKVSGILWGEGDMPIYHQ